MAHIKTIGKSFILSNSSCLRSTSSNGMLIAPAMVPPSNSLLGLTSTRHADSLFASLVNWSQSTLLPPRLLSALNHSNIDRNKGTERYQLSIKNKLNSSI